MLALMIPDPNLPLIVHAIQLAVAPVFLLTGIAALLGVMAGRLSRIIDRARELEDKWSDFEAVARAAAATELADLEHRRQLAAWAINLFSFAALLVCLVVVSLFADAMFALELKWLAGVLFIVTMLTLIAGLGLFLREVWRASQTVRLTTARFMKKGG